MTAEDSNPMDDLSELTQPGEVEPEPAPGVPEPKKAPAKMTKVAPAKAVVTKPADFDPEPEPREIHVHFLGEGFTALGKVWHRGEELKINELDPQFRLLIEADGTSRLEWDEDQQWNKYGEVKWGQGPWPFRGYDLGAHYDTKFVDPDTGAPFEMSDAERKKLEAANKARGLAAPGK